MDCGAKFCKQLLLLLLPSFSSRSQNNGSSHSFSSRRRRLFRDSFDARRPDDEAGLQSQAHRYQLGSQYHRTRHSCKSKHRFEPNAKRNQGGALRWRCLSSAERPHRLVVRLVSSYPIHTARLPSNSYPLSRSPTPHKVGSPIGVPMLWGDGTADAQDAKRYAQFKKLASPPPFVLGFEEPDCEGNGSAGMSVDDGVYQWEKMIAPLKASGTKLGSPAMCSKWLQSFQRRSRD